MPPTETVVSRRYAGADLDELVSSLYAIFWVSRAMGAPVLVTKQGKFDDVLLKKRECAKALLIAYTIAI